VGLLVHREQTIAVADLMGSTIDLGGDTSLTKRES
jgi:hypothetical protein